MLGLNGLCCYCRGMVGLPRYVRIDGVCWDRRGMLGLTGYFGIEWKMMGLMGLEWTMMVGMSSQYCASNDVIVEFSFCSR